MLYLCPKEYIITNIILFLTEQQKQSIIESGKDYFRSIIIPSHLKNLKMLKLKDFNVNPFMFQYLDASFESLAKALLYPKAFEVIVCQGSSAGLYDLFWKISRMTRRVTINKKIGELEFVDAIDGRKKYCCFTNTCTELIRCDLNAILSQYKCILNEKMQGDLSFQIDDLVVGVVFGEHNKLSPNYKTLETTFPVYCGAEFWEHLMGDKHFYSRLLNAFVEVVEQEDMPVCDCIRKKVKEIAQEIAEKRE